MDRLAAYWSLSALTANGIILLHLLGALAVGCIIGYERSFHGRAAGLRTFALVCVAATLLTVVGGFPAEWFGGRPGSGLADPTRIIQGIVTGIGFVGAGVIMKEGLTIRGLSTAASIWMTSAIGVAIGLGFFAAAIAATLMSVIVMGAFRRLEIALPHHRILHLSLSFPRQSARSPQELSSWLEQLGFRITDLACQLGKDGTLLEYDLILQSFGSAPFDRLAETLTKAKDVVAFQLAPARD
ncbi:MgtC/SapB family protein [Telmatospirillum sp.]|uniref:MgtC/SapB family protein n=1 Tax=Telmatospirillum sp. TaxID=2079197 RepID=UPI002846DDDD|nr:MgtC/SapB family protein [Telmatospirillum sp.]MDR3440761.1 MgtC/SapB family protein [Telmatospirillum sp.]